MKLFLAASLALMVARAAFGQCGPEVVLGLGGEVRAIGQVHDSMLLVGFGNNAQLVNVFNPSAPTFVIGRLNRPWVPLNAPARKIAMTPGASRAFILEESGRLVAVGLGSFGVFGPFPNDVGVIGTRASCVDVVADGNLAYVVLPNLVEVYDTGTGSFTRVGQLSPLTGNYRFDRAVKIGATLWVGFHEHESTIYGVSGFNVSNPAAPQHIVTTLSNVSFDVSQARVEAMTSIGNNLFIAYENEVNNSFGDWVRALDVTTPTSPVWRPGADTGAQVLSMSPVGVQLHLALGGNDLAIWHAGVPSALVQIGSYAMPGAVHDVVSVTGTDYVAAGRAGLYLLNTTDPAAVSTRSLLGTAPATPTIVRATGGNPATVAVMDSTWGYVRLYTTGSPGLLPGGFVSIGGSAQHMELAVQPGGAYACIAFGRTVLIVNISNAGNPVAVGSVDLGQFRFARHMAAFSTRLYVFDDIERLHVIDLSNPAFPATRSITQYGGSDLDYTCMTAWADTVALGTRSFGLWLINTANATAPLVSAVWNPTTGYEVHSLVKSPSRLYVNASVTSPFSNTRLEVLDVSVLSNPVLIWRADPQTGGQASKMKHLIYVGNATHKFLIGTTAAQDFDFFTESSLGTMSVWDVTDPSAAVQIQGRALWALTGRAASYAIGERLFASGRHAGIYDMTTPDQWMPAFFTRPPDVTVCYGEDVVLDAGPISASPAPTGYRWERDFTPIFDGPTPWGSIISGAGTPVLTIINPRPEDAFNVFGIRSDYRCTATNTCGTRSGGLAEITVCAADVDCNFVTDVFDLLAYLDLWFAGAPGADLDGAAGVTVFDLLTYLDNWFAGC